VAAKPVALDTRRFLNRKQQAEWLRKHKGLPVTQRTLMNLARRGKGPAFISFLKFKLSTPEQLDAWASEVEARGCI
jgi:hypothetical protein